MKRNKQTLLKGALLAALAATVLCIAVLSITGSTAFGEESNSFDITISPDRIYGDLSATGVYHLPDGADYTIKQYNAVDGNTFNFLTTDGRVYSMGSTANGNAGIGAPKRDVLIAPERVRAGEAALDGSGNYEEINGVKYLANIVSVTNCFAWDADGRVYSWGINANARLGIGSSDTGLIKYEPVRVKADTPRVHADDYEYLPANGSFAAGYYMTNIELMNILSSIPTAVTQGEHRFYSWGTLGTWYSYANLQPQQTTMPRPVLAGEAADPALGHPDDYYTVDGINYLKNVDSAAGSAEEQLVVAGGRMYACGRNRGVGGPTWITTLAYTTGLKRLPAGPSVLAADKETLGGRVVFKETKQVLSVAYNTYLMLMESGNMYGCGCNRWGMLNTGNPNNADDQGSGGTTADPYIRIRALADATADGNNDGLYLAKIDRIYRSLGGWWAVARDGHVYATGQNTGGLLGAGDDVRVNMQSTRVRAGDAVHYGSNYYFTSGGKQYLKFDESMAPGPWGSWLLAIFIDNDVLNWGNNSSFQHGLYDNTTNIMFGLSRAINDYLPRVYMTIEDTDNKVVYLDPTKLEEHNPYTFETKIFNNGLYRMEVSSPPYMVFEKNIRVNTIGANDFTYSLSTTVGDDVRTADIHFTPYFRDNEIADIAAGNSYTAVLTPDRLVYTWGTSDILTTGVLGNGELLSGGSASNTVYRVVAGDAALDGSGNFVEIAGVKYLTKVEKLFAAYNHMLAVTFDGQVYAWGDNSEGQLGIGTSGTFEDVPRRVLAGEAATKVNAAEANLYYESCAANGSFSAGNYLTNIAAVGHGRYNSAFITKDAGLVFLTGRNTSGQLANSTTTSVSIPIRLRAGNMNKVDIFGSAFSASDTYETVGGVVYARKIKNLSFGYDHMALVTVNNMPLVSGSNAQRQIGLIGGNGAAETGESAAIAANTTHLRITAYGQTAMYAGEVIRGLGFTGDPSVVPDRGGIGGGVKDVIAAPYATAFLFESGHVGVTGNQNTYGQNGTSSTNPHFNSNFLNYVVAGEATTDGSGNWQTMYSRTGAGPQTVLNKIVKFGAFSNESFTMLALDGSLYSIGRNNGTTAYLGRSGITSTASPVRVLAGIAANDPNDFETVGSNKYFKSPGIKLVASGNNLIVSTPMLNFYAFGAVENSPVFGRDIHDKISGILISAERSVDIIGPYFTGWPYELQQHFDGLTAQQKYIVNVPENGVYLARMYYNGQLSGTDTLTITELDHIDLSKAFGAGGQNKINYAFYLRHKYQVGMSETVDDDLWILGPAGTGTDQFPTDLPGAGPAVLHITAAQLQAMYNGGNNLARIPGVLNVSGPGTYTAVIERSGKRPTPDNSWRIVQSKEIAFGEYLITEKYRDTDNKVVQADTFTDLTENADYSKEPPVITGYTYKGWKLDTDPTLRTDAIELAAVVGNHTVTMVYERDTTTIPPTDGEGTEPPSGPQVTPQPPQTGDNTTLIAVLVLVVVATATAGGVVISKRKKKDD